MDARSKDGAAPAERESLEVVFDILNDAGAVAPDPDRLRQVLHNMPIMMNAFDENGVCVAWNRECEKVLGFSADDMIGHPHALEVYVPDAAYRELMQTQWTGKGDHWDWEVGSHGERRQQTRRRMVQHCAQLSD